MSIVSAFRRWSFRMFLAVSLARSALRRFEQLRHKVCLIEKTGKRSALKASMNLVLTGNPGRIALARRCEPPLEHRRALGASASLLQVLAKRALPACTSNFFMPMAFLQRTTSSRGTRLS